MGNLLETDSDVASISDNERERTDGDGMESENVLDVNKQLGASLMGYSVDSTAHPKQPDKVPSSVEADPRRNMLQVADGLNAGEGTCGNGGFTMPGAKLEPIRVTSVVSGSTKSKIMSPRELPPKNQLIQVKPTVTQPKLNNRKSMESLPEQAINKQRNPRFIPYEPYRGAVRPIVAHPETSKKHSRNSSESSCPSSAVRQSLINLTLQDSSVDQAEARSVLNTQLPDGSGSPSHLLKLSAQDSGHGNSVEKQSHALTLLKERLKIAEKDNDDLHKENIRLKKLLVDSLSGDIIRDRGDAGIENSRGIPKPSTSESVDTLSNEIEVWRSKFLSSCVLVEQLTRENGSLNDAVGSAANLFKDIKLSSSLSPSEFERVNEWLRTHKAASASSPEKDPTSSCS